MSEKVNGPLENDKEQMKSKTLEQIIEQNSKFLTDLLFYIALKEDEEQEQGDK